MTPRVRALLLPLCLLPAACVKAPPVMNPTSVPAPAVPLPPALTDNAQFGYVRAHQLVRMADRLGASSLVNMAAQKGADLRALDPNKSLVVVVGDPGAGAGVDKLPVTALLPISPGGSMAQRLSALLGNGVTEHGGGVAVAVNAEPVRSGPAAALLDALAGAPLSSDLELYVRVTSLMARYGDTVHGFISRIEEELRKAQNADGTLFGDGVASAYGSWLRGFIDGMESLSFGMGAGDSALTVSTTSEDKSPAGRQLPSSASNMAELARFVPEGDFRFEAVGRDFSKLLDLVNRLYEPLFKDDPAGLAEMKQIMATMMKGRYQSAMSMSFVPERLIRATVVSLVDDPEERFDAARRALALFNRPSIKAAMAKGGVEMTIESRRDARQIEGWPVDHVSYGFKFGDKVRTPEVEHLLSKPFEVEMIRIGRYLVYEINGTPASLDKIVADLLAGNGPYPSLAARADHPAGGYLYGDLDVARLLESVRGIVKESKRDEVPRFDANMPHVTTFGYEAGGVTWHKVNVPLRLIDAVRDLAGRAGRNDGAYLPAPKD